MNPTQRSRLQVAPSFCNAKFSDIGGKRRAGALSHRTNEAFYLRVRRQGHIVVDQRRGKVAKKTRRPAKRDQVSLQQIRHHHCEDFVGKPSDNRLDIRCLLHIPHILRSVQVDHGIPVKPIDVYHRFETAGIQYAQRYHVARAANAKVANFAVRNNHRWRVGRTFRAHFFLSATRLYAITFELWILNTVPRPPVSRSPEGAYSELLGGYQRPAGKSF
ncbi:hypothetical protein B0H13DRAFT_1857076 [Mycena leptocephala]|nr:hypothetical protein B0H13DRAFT_1857076 [Mycena leptocephala]